MNAISLQFDNQNLEISGKPETAVELISAFKAADMRLRLAIEQDADDDIVHFGEQVDQLVSALLAAEAQDASERMTLLRFLVDRFVLREDSSTELRRAVCDKLLALA